MTTRSKIGRPHAARALATVFLLLAALLTGLQVPIAAQAAGTASISGKVTLEADVPTEWMQGVGVSVSSVSGSSSGFASPARDGSFVVTGLEAGAFRVRYTVSSYWDSTLQKSVQPNLVSEYFGDTTDYSLATQVTVDPGASATGIDATLGKGGILSGKVTLPPDAPAEWRQGVSVQASGDSGGYGYGVLGQDGTYSVVGLPAGAYRVQFAASMYYTTGGAPVRPNLVSEYYDDATYSTAKLVPITKGNTTTGIDASLARGATITGRVTLPSDVPAGWISAVNVRASSSVSGGAGAYGSVNADGTYVLTGLAADTYRIYFSPNSTWWNPSTQQSEATNLVAEYYNDTLDSASAQTITLSPGDTKSEINAALAKGSTIQGRVSIPSGSPADWLKGVRVSASQTDGSGSGFAPEIRADGFYTIRGLPAGAYRVSFSTDRYLDSRGQYVTPSLLNEYYDGTRDYAKATLVTVGAGADRTGIDATLEAGASITGKITLPADAPAEWMRAVYVSVTLASGEYVSAQSSTSMDGNYTVSGLPAGDYKVRFWVGSLPSGSGYVQPNLVSEYYDDAANAASARVLPLRSGETRSKVDATLAKGSQLSGQVRGLAANTYANVELINVADPEGADYNGATVATDGSFAVLGIRPGSYWARLYASTSADGGTNQFLKNPSGGYTFTLAGAGLLNQSLTALPATASISGSLTAGGFEPQPADPDDTRALADTRVYQKLDSTWVPLDLRGSYVIGSVSVKNNGTVGYTVPGLTAGTYTVGFEKSQTPYSSDPAVTEQWWQKKGSLAAADAVTLSVGQKQLSIDGTVTGQREMGGFVDIGGSAFVTEITWMKNQGISTGYEGPNGREYRPFGKVTRDAMAAFLYRTAGSPTFTAPSASPFIDVPVNHPFYKEIAWLSTQNISNGWSVDGGKEYRPSLNITRDAMAAFLYRFDDASTAAPPESPFSDVPLDSPFLKEIAWLSAEGISTGWDDGTGGRAFRPYDDITRDAMAAFLYRLEHR